MAKGYELSRHAGMFVSEDHLDVINVDGPTMGTLGPMGPQRTRVGVKEPRAKRVNGRIRRRRCVTDPRPCIEAWMTTQGEQFV